MRKDEAHDFVVSIIKKCRTNPLHEHWVYDCPDVHDALTEFGELKVAEGAVEVRRQIPCQIGNGRCLHCWACTSLRAAEDRVVKLRAACQARLLNDQEDARGESSSRPTKAYCAGASWDRAAGASRPCRMPVYGTAYCRIHTAPADAHTTSA